jgi:RimJ/RimL family protein N-acetyltransferase
LDGSDACGNTSTVAEKTRLKRLDENVLDELLAVAISEAEPEDVMPPVDGPSGWTEARREAFRAFHRERYAGFAGSYRTVMYAIVVDGRVSGMIRMSLCDEPHTVETGMWLGRSSRGMGIGVAALRALLEEAGNAAVRVVIAETTTTNVAALAALRRCGAIFHEGTGRVRAEIRLVP